MEGNLVELLVHALHSHTMEYERFDALPLPEYNRPVRLSRERNYMIFVSRIEGQRDVLSGLNLSGSEHFLPSVTMSVKNSDKRWV